MATPAPTHTWQAERYATNARFVADLGAPVLALLAPQPGERILDLGCGDGALTGKLAAAGVAVVGVDASPEMIEAARARSLDARDEVLELLRPCLCDERGCWTAVTCGCASPRALLAEDVAAGAARAGANLPAREINPAGRC